MGYIVRIVYGQCLVEQRSRSLLGEEVPRVRQAFAPFWWQPRIKKIIADILKMFIFNDEILKTMLTAYIAMHTHTYMQAKLYWYGFAWKKDTLYL